LQAREEVKTRYILRINDRGGRERMKLTYDLCVMDNEHKRYANLKN